MNNNVTEVLKDFIPHEHIESKNRTYLRWVRGLESVEVQIPGFKIGKLGTYEKRPWIVASFIHTYKTKTGRTTYKQMTSSYVYDKARLESLLKELTR